MTVHASWVRTYVTDMFGSVKDSYVKSVLEDALVELLESPTETNGGCERYNRARYYKLVSIKEGKACVEAHCSVLCVLQQR